MDTKLDRPVAIKELAKGADDLGSSHFADYVRRFEREARVQAGFNHPNIVHVYELIQESADRLYLVMEFVDGESLRDALARRGPLPVDEAVRITSDLLAGLAAVHADPRDIVHRDIKPSNVLLTKDGQAKLADFGLAQVGDESLRSEGGKPHPGTALYMSPEQETTNAYLYPASDLFSVGCVLFEMLTGVPYKRAKKERKGLAELRPDAPPWLGEIVTAALAKDPDDRPANAAEMGRLLAERRTKAEAEVRAKAQVEEQARQEARRKAEEEAERARLAEQEQQRRDAEEQARQAAALQAQAAAQQAAQQKAAQETEQQRLAEAAERAREEAVRKARAEAEATQRAEEDTRARLREADAKRSLEEQKLKTQTGRPASVPPRLAAVPAGGAQPQEGQGKSRRGLWVALFAVVLLGAAAALMLLRPGARSGPETAAVQPPLLVMTVAATASAPTALPTPDIGATAQVLSQQIATQTVQARKSTDALVAKQQAGTAQVAAKTATARAGATATAAKVTAAESARKATATTIAAATDQARRATNTAVAQVTAKAIAAATKSAQSTAQAKAAVPTATTAPAKPSNCQPWHKKPQAGYGMVLIENHLGEELSVDYAIGGSGHWTIVAKQGEVPGRWWAEVPVGTHVLNYSTPKGYGRATFHVESGKSYVSPLWYNDRSDDLVYPLDIPAGCQ